MMNKPQAHEHIERATSNHTLPLGCGVSGAVKKHMTTLRKQVSDALCQQGYRRRGRGHLRRVDTDFSLCVDTGPLGPRKDIHPFVGIRSDCVERAVFELMGLEQDDWTATVGANVGYVLNGEYRWWDEGAPVQEILDAIDAALARFRPYMHLTTLAGAFKFQGAAENPGKPYTLVVIALLNRDANLVARLLADAEAILCARPDAVCDQFKDFEMRVTKRLSTMAG